MTPGRSRWTLNEVASHTARLSDPGTRVNWDPKNAVAAKRSPWGCPSEECGSSQSTPSGLIQRFPFAATVFGIVFASASSADPILTVFPDEIELSPTTTVVTVEVDPNDTPLSAVLLNFSSLASGLEMLAVTPTDAQIISSDPTLNGDDWEGGFVGSFGQDRTQPFEVGT